MRTPQGGIFALGTASHAYLEFDARPGRAAGEAVVAIASLREPRTTMGGVNLVAGFRPSLWADVVPDDAPANVHDFDHLVGADGFVMPATQHDAVLWLSGSAYDVVFEVARKAIAELRSVATCGVRKVGSACKSAVFAHAIEFTHPTRNHAVARDDGRGQR